jgi:hypothetical protein
MRWEIPPRLGEEVVRSRKESKITGVFTIYKASSAQTNIKVKFT